MKIILNILTHGNERIGVAVAAAIYTLGISKKNLTIQIANPRAFAQGVRYIDQDLNRSFPGAPGGNYETRRAYQLLRKIVAADLVIDIHSTTSSLRDAVIVTKLDAATRACIEVFAPRYVLHMRVKNDRALISNAKIGIAFEYGRDGDVTVLKKNVRDVKKIFAWAGVVSSKAKTYSRVRRSRTVYFDVVREVVKPAGYRLVKGIENYRLVREGQIYARDVEGNTLVASEDFYPILFGQNNYETIFGFAAHRVDD